MASMAASIQRLVDSMKTKALASVVPGDTEAPTVCTLIQGDFDKFIQFCLALLSLSVLVLKRCKESPRRPFTIWAFDASKQCFGAGVAHLSNVFISIYFAHWEGSKIPSDECAIYFLNFVLDTTFGVLISYAFLVFLQALAMAIGGNCAVMLRTGYYGDVPSIRIWGVQLLAWLVIIFLTKLVIAAIITLLWPSLNALGNFLFGGFEGYRKLELVLVMIICPTLLNAIQFWVQDNFLKASGNERDNVERLPLMKVMTPALQKLLSRTSSTLQAGDGRPHSVSISVHGQSKRLD